MNFILIKNFLFQEDINAVFIGSLSAKTVAKNGSSTSPKVRKILHQLQHKSPPTTRRPSVALHPKRPSTSQCPTSPTKHRRKSEVSLRSGNRKCSLGSQNNKRETWETWKEYQLHAWSQSILKDFDSIVQEEITILSRSNSPKSILVKKEKRENISIVDGLIRNTYLSDLTCDKKLIPNRRSLDLSLRPPKPPPRTDKSKGNTFIDKSFKGDGENTILRRSLSSPEKISLAREISPSANLAPRSNLDSAVKMGSNISSLGTNREDKNIPYNTYSLPRGRRRVSLGIGHIKSNVTLEHPDAPASPCQLLRVGPRLSRSHSLDEAFVPLSQRTYFVPTPLTPAPTPLLRKENNTKSRRIGVIDIPPFNNMFSDGIFGRRESNSLRKGSLCSDSSIINNEITDFKTLLSVDLNRSTVSTINNETIGSTCKYNTHNTSTTEGNHDVRIVIDHDHTSNKEVLTNTDASLLKPDRPRFGRKSEPSLPASFPPLHPLTEGRRHTLPNKPGGIYSLVPPTFNTSSWDALPPAEEVEVMEDKPIQPDCHADKLCKTTSINSLPNRKFTHLTPAMSTHLPIPQSYSPSLNSSLSSLSGFSGQENGSDFDSIVNLPFNSEDVTDNACHHSNGLQDTISETINGIMPLEHQDNNLSPKGTTTINSTSKLSKVSETDNLCSSSPASSPEPITAKLQLLPLKNGDCHNDEMLFSVVIPQNYKRKKRKVKLKRYSDTCLVSRRSIASESVRAQQRKSANYCPPSDTIDSPCSDDSALPSDSNDGFLRYCMKNLKLSKSDLRKGKLIPSNSYDYKSTDEELIKAIDNVCHVKKRKLHRRSWSNESSKTSQALRGSASAKDISALSLVIVSIIRFIHSSIHY